MVTVFLIRTQIDCSDDGTLKGRKADTFEYITTINLYEYIICMYVLSELDILYGVCCMDTIIF